MLSAGTSAMYEAIVIGGGPAGLQAAMTLGRALIKSLVLDEGKPRNAPVVEFHNFLGQDGKNPAEFRKQQREHITKSYGDFVEFASDVVSSIEGSVGNFVIETESKKRFGAQRIILATGVREEVPPHWQNLYYKSVFQCPFCHGFEERGKKFAIIDPHMADQVLMFRTWSQDMMLFTNGMTIPWLTDEIRARFAKAKIDVVDGVITEYEVAKENPGQLKAIHLADGRRIERDVIYTKLKITPNKLVQDLKLELEPMGFVKVSQPKLETSVPGIHAVGDTITMMHSVAMAVSSGMQAGAMITMEMGLAREAALNKST